jgi:hypothetical protein
MQTGIISHLYVISYSLPKIGMGEHQQIPSILREMTIRLSTDSKWFFQIYLEYPAKLENELNHSEGDIVLEFLTKNRSVEF